MVLGNTSESLWIYDSTEVATARSEASAKAAKRRCARRTTVARELQVLLVDDRRLPLFDEGDVTKRGHYPHGLGKLCQTLTLKFEIQMACSLHLNPSFSGSIFRINFDQLAYLVVSLIFINNGNLCVFMLLLSITPQWFVLQYFSSFSRQFSGVLLWNFWTYFGRFLIFFYFSEAFLTL